jgi:NADPH:quinone reductase-like Zn-dependent oxidoreductase
MAQLPTQNKGLILSKGTSVVEDGIAIPPLAANEILIKTKAVAINPTDWKHIDNEGGFDGSVVGCDGAGIVVAVGEDIKETKVGDERFYFVSGSSRYHPLIGAFSKYVIVKEWSAFKTGTKLTVGHEKIIKYGPVTTFEGAASLGLALVTLGFAFKFYGQMSIQPEEYKDKLFLLWGGSSSLGQAVVQIAKYMGFKVIATCSPSRFEWVKSIGADDVYDYKGKDVGERIREKYGDDIQYSYDAVCSNGSQEIVHTAMSSTKPAKMFVSLLTQAQTPKSNVEIIFSMAYSAIDKKKYYPATKSDVISPPGAFEATQEAIEEINQIFEKDPNLIKHMPLQVYDGIDSLNEAIDLVRKNKHSGSKVVVRFD